jgi:hypothetical protein
MAIRTLVPNYLFALLTLVAPTLSAQTMGDVSSSSTESSSDARSAETITITAKRSLTQRFLSTGSMVTVDRQDWAPTRWVTYCANCLACKPHQTPMAA